MLKLAKDLPERAILGDQRAALRAVLDPTTALWFEADKTRFNVDKSRAISAWRSGDTTATPAQPNDGNGTLSRFVKDAGLTCQTGLNCGLTVEKATQNATRFTMAVLYRPAIEGDPETLLTVNTGYNGGDDKDAAYLFLAERDGELSVKDTRGSIELNVPSRAKPGEDHFVIVTLAGDTIALAQNVAPAEVMRGAQPPMQNPADLFIGCRSHRKGLKKTLGNSIIREVFFWPDHTLLLPRSDEDAHLYRQLKLYQLWNP